MNRLLVVMLSCLALAACGDTPQPFKGSKKVTADVAVLDVPSAVGIAVVPVDGLPQPLNGQLTAAIAKALEVYEIPAEPVPVNQGLGFSLEGRVVDKTTANGSTTADLLWILKGRNGREAGLYMQAIAVTDQQWQLGSLAAAAQTGRDTAEAIAAIIDGDTQRAAGATDRTARTAAGTAKDAGASPAPRPLRVSVKPMEGAPGDGRESLQLATLETLLANGVTRDDVNPDVVLIGSVKTEPSVNGQEFMTIAWRAIAQDGEELGEVKLTNNIPKGALDGRWGPTAFAIAEAGLPQMLELLSFAPRF
ncbi:MAG: hypothetical protein JNK21_00580 [Rhodospirillaceae bacterium]|nr:hypothetical protein [Rhodospirillaceae bacterium]